MRNGLRWAETLKRSAEGPTSQYALATPSAVSPRRSAMGGSGGPSGLGVSSDTAGQGLTLLHFSAQLQLNSKASLSYEVG